MKTLGQNWQNWVVAALAATWLAAQNVGIGTTTPLTRLHVAEGDIFLGDATGTDGFVLHSRAWAGYDFFQISTRTGGSYEWSKGITLVRGSGNVGIGTTNPGTTLEVAGTITAGPAGGGCWLIINDITGARWRFCTGDHDLAIQNYYPAGTWSTKVLINENGNVGIGTTAPHPAAILQLQATDKGFLPTQVSLTSATQWSPLVGSSVDGMLVYNTATAGTGQDRVSPGYYYWRAGRWRRFNENAYAGAIQGVLYNNCNQQQQNLTSNCWSWQYLNSYIDLPPGKWIVYSVQLLTPSSSSTEGAIWVRTTLSDNSNCTGSSSDIIGSWLISGLLPHDAPHSLISGQIFINNTSSSVKRYYYCGCKGIHNGYNANLTNFSTTCWSENQIYALPAD